MKEAERQPFLVIDTEYQKREQYGTARIIGVSWGFPVGSTFRSYYAPFRHEIEYAGRWNLDPVLLAEFQRFPKEGTQVYHNWQADHTVFLHEGIDFSDRHIFDTMVATHLGNENHLSYKLDDLARTKFKARKISLTGLEQDSGGWEHINPLAMGEYACTDVWLTFLLYRDAVAILQQQALDNLYDRYEQFIKVLHKVVSRGLHVDVDLAKKLQDEGRTELTQLLEKYKFNLGSSQLVAKHLHGELQVPVKYRTPKKQKKNKAGEWVTSGGAPSTDSFHLRRYRDEYPESRGFTQDVLNYRTINKAVGTWYEGFVTKRGADGLLHPGLSLVGGGEDEKGGTKTGRLTCRNPNLQQIPRKGDTKNLFIAPDGWVLVEVDLSQAELRTTGYYMKMYGDPVIANSYREGTDLHALTSQNMGLTALVGAAEGRQVAKQCNFSLCYRAGPAMLQHILYRDANMDKTLAEATDLHGRWHRAFPLIAFMNKKAEEKARKTGYIELWNGRRRHLRPEEAGKAYNSLIQGSIGQFMMEAMIAIDTELPATRVVNQVHDSLWIYMRRDTWQEEAAAIQSIMKRIPENVTGEIYEVDAKLIGGTK